VIGINESVGPYRLDAELGKGGMGIVYRAHDSRLLRNVALKIIRPTSLSPGTRASFFREAQLASSLNHPGIVTIYDVLEHEGVDCIVMEYIDGASLKEAIPKGIDPGDAIRLANELKLSEHTVRNYLFHIFDKLGVSSRIELALYAVSCTKGKPASGVQDDQLERNSAGSAELAGELFLLADPGSGAESPLRRKNSPRGRLQLT